MEDVVDNALHATNIRDVGGDGGNDDDGVPIALSVPPHAMWHSTSV